MRSLIGCGVEPGSATGSLALNAAAGLSRPDAAVHCLTVLIEAGYLESAAHVGGMSPLNSSRTIEAATLLIREGASTNQDTVARHEEAGRHDIGSAIATAQMAPQIERRPPATNRAHWVRFALAARDGHETGNFITESDKLILMVEQLSRRLQEKSAENSALSAEIEALKSQSCTSSVSITSNATAGDHKLAAAHEEAAAAHELAAKKITDLHEALARTQSELAASQAAAQSAEEHRCTAAAAEQRMQNALEDVQKLQEETAQLRAAAAGAVGQLTQGTHALTEQRERADRAAAALTESKTSHQRTQYQLEQAQHECETWQEALSAAEAKLDKETGTPHTSSVSITSNATAGDHKLAAAHEEAAAAHELAAKKITDLHEALARTQSELAASQAAAQSAEEHRCTAAAAEQRMQNALEDVQKLQEETAQLRAAAAGAVGQLTQGTHALTEQRERADRAAAALTESKTSHQRTQYQLEQAQHECETLQEALSAAEAKPDKETGTPHKGARASALADLPQVRDVMLADDASITACVLRCFSEHTARTKTTVKTLLSRYTSSNGGAGNELSCLQFHAAARQVSGMNIP